VSATALLHFRLWAVQPDGAEVYVQHLSLAPNLVFAWHTHPGPVVVTVRSGSLTYQDAGPNSCRNRTYTAGEGFVDPGFGHVHRVIAGPSGAEIYSTFLPSARVGEPHRHNRTRGGVFVAAQCTSPAAMGAAKAAPIARLWALLHPRQDGGAGSAVVEACAHRGPDEYEWITDEIEHAYGALHELGWAHSVEAWSLPNGDDSAALREAFAEPPVTAARTS
jgi:quercetin dioxygenase-like cupin family protein